MTADRQVFARLAAYLHGRREHMLNAWSTTARHDSAMPVLSALSRRQFYDHIPKTLDALERRLAALPGTPPPIDEKEQKEAAIAHGAQRWQQGYDEFDTVREWGRLQQVILDELEGFRGDAPDFGPEMMHATVKALSAWHSECVAESAQRLSALQKGDAAARVRDLENAMAHLAEVSREKANLWRELAHDLRGRVGVVTNVSMVLRHGAAGEARSPLQDVFERSLRALNELLNDLMSLARLEAGHEVRIVKRFDAASVLETLCNTMEETARRRRLVLSARGPESLVVQGDPVKVERIAQNLILNAIAHTEKGGVEVSWESNSPALQWTLSVQDSGPGLPSEPAGVDATSESNRTLPGDAAGVAQGGDVPAANPRTIHGEGIGLSIVKRLCELLDATMEIDSGRGGTLIKVTFPAAYSE